MVILSGNLLNEHLNVVIVVPLTTKIKKYKSNPILSPTKLNGLKSESEMLVFHIRSVAKERLLNKRGSIGPNQLERALKTLTEILKY